MQENRFLKLREESGLSQTELSKELKGVSRQMVINHEISSKHGGQKNYNPETLKEYSRYFNVSIDYLLNNSDTRNMDEDIRMIGNTTGLSDESINTLKILKDKKPEGFRYLHYIDTLNFILSNEKLCEVFLDYFGVILDNPFDVQLHYDKENDTLEPEKINRNTLSKIRKRTVISPKENHVMLGSTKDETLQRAIPISFLEQSYDKDMLFQIISKYKELYQQAKKGSD